MNNFPVIRTKRLNLIELHPSQLDDLFEIYSDEETMRYWDEFAHESVSKTKEVYDMVVGGYEKGTGICWAIQDKLSLKIIGTFSYNHYKKGGTASIGYILHKNYWGKGLMTEIARPLIQYGIEVLGVNRIEAHVEPDNIASQKLLLKLGFTKEGLLRQKHFYKNRWYDIIFFSFLAGDELR